MEVEPRHANRSGDKEITKYQPVGSKLTPWSRNLSGYAEGQYGVDGPYYDVAAELEALQPKSRPLEHCRFGGTDTLIALIACPNDICRNLTPWQQDLCQIWHLQCTFMADLADALYMKTPEYREIAFRISLSFTIEPMSADRELQDLLREFEQTGLQHIFASQPEPTAHEETLPASTPPMQKRFSRKQFKPKFRSKRNED